MKLTIYTLATDDDTGTNSQVFPNEEARDDALLSWVSSDRDEWAGSEFADNLHEFIQSKTDYMDTFSTDEQEIGIDPVQLVGIDEAWKICKAVPGAFGNLYDPDEVLTIMDGWSEAGDTSEDSNWFDPTNAEDKAAILAWCEQEGPDFEDQTSNLVCENLPNRGEAFKALAAKREQEGKGSEA
ncbi:hypothetical protein [Ruegeria sp. HKCCD8929]|uniref:hypothetical protein n=1 Tax=Ruegeria sp. HKCCD8929 TaxID=2683006 RepID=UPI001489F548|nr:hypothetical protein [Ruegeria sp. HKCCD8929]